MKYYIFGNKSRNDVIISTYKNAQYESDDLNKALDMYKKYVDEVRYFNCYLVVDFEMTKSKMFKISSLDNDSEDIMPFLIIGEYHVGDDKNDIIRKDHTYIQFRGKKNYTIEYQDNLTAVKAFDYHWKEKANCKFGIIYSKSTIALGAPVDMVYDRTLADTIELVMNDKLSFIKKFKITSPEWNIIPLKERLFQMYVLPKLDYGYTEKEVRCN